MPAPPAEDTPATPHPEAFLRGVKLGLPIFLGYVPAGMAFGILARAVGFSVFQAALCSATALAGAGQFIALDVIKAAGTVAAVLVATSVVNLRYVLFGSTLSPYLHRAPTGMQGILAFSLTDETFAVNITDLREGRATLQSMAGVGAIAWTGWVLGTAIGATGAGFIGDANRFGVQFAMPAMFTALFVALAEDARQVAIGLVGAAIVVGLPLLSSLGIGVSQGWYVVIASMLAATIGTAVFR
jgi:4-azaleucine resistance transporter AzlC